MTEDKKATRNFQPKIVIGTRQTGKTTWMLTSVGHEMKESDKDIVVFFPNSRIMKHWKEKRPDLTGPKIAWKVWPDHNSLPNEVLEMEDTIFFFMDYSSHCATAIEIMKRVSYTLGFGGFPNPVHLEMSMDVHPLNVKFLV